MCHFRCTLQVSSLFQKSIGGALAMTFACKSAALAALTFFAFATPASADIGQLVGTWQNVNSHDRGVIRFVVHHVGNAVRVQVFGNCTPTPCDWGTVNAAVFGTGVQSSLPQQATELSASYNQGFAQRQVIIHIVGNQLRADVLTRFTDKSGRADYFDSDLFNRVGDPPPGGIAYENCISFNPNTAHAANIQGDWKLVDGNMWLLSFGNKRAEARRAALHVKHHQFNKKCFVGHYSIFLADQQSQRGR